MQYNLLDNLRCPVTRSKFTLKIIKERKVVFDKTETTVIEEGILFSETEWFYPIIGDIPRLCVESFIDHQDFLKKHLKDYDLKKNDIYNKYKEFLEYVIKKNRRTKKSFTKEWSLYDFEKDKTWDAGDEQMFERFLIETGETITSLQSKIVLDAGCGNGKLNCLLANKKITNFAMDFSESIIVAHKNNHSAYVHFIQGDVQFPPFCFNYFDLLHCSGVLIHTNNTELSLSCLTALIKKEGKMSVFLYHPRKDFVHNLFNKIRKVSSKLPLGFQYYLYAVTLLPVSYVVKKIKGNPQNLREMMVDILDWFTPEFRSEHTHSEVAFWFKKRGFENVSVTVADMFGFNTVACKVH